MIAFIGSATLEIVSVFLLCCPYCVGFVLTPVASQLQYSSFSTLHHNLASRKEKGGGGTSLICSHLSGKQLFSQTSLLHASRNALTYLWIYLAPSLQGRLGNWGQDDND